MNVERFWVPLVLIVALSGLLAIPSPGFVSAGSAHPISAAAGAPATAVELVAHDAPTAADASSAIAHPATSFPRTVLIETFTGVWCPHCPIESQALYYIEQNTSPNVISIAELHVCAFAPPSPCLENYVPPDNTSDLRGAFYGVGGFPTVYFDGNNPQAGVNPSYTVGQEEKIYNDSIANASAYPGNVSIDQSAVIESGNVSVTANITSAVTGTYNVVSYLMEDINKTGVSNGAGPHDIGRIVRETLHNHPANLTSGSTTKLEFTGGILSTWNPLNLSVVTFVQQNSTKIIQNANLAPVLSMTATASASQSPVTMGNTTTITVHVMSTNQSASLAGASVSFGSSDGGAFAPASGVTDSGGFVTTVFTAPNVTRPVPVVVSGVVTDAGYTPTVATTTVVVNPLVLSPIPSGLTVTPGAGVVTLNWTAPQTGGLGVTYYVYRGTTATAGSFSLLGTSFSTWYNDTSVAGGESYWYSVSAWNSTAFSANSTASGASAITATPLGLPSSVGWKIAIDGSNFTSLSSRSLSLFLPDGTFDYQFESTTYAYETAAGTSTVTTNGAPQVLTAQFVPRYATLSGTVQPAGATVTIAGTAVSVTNGAFSEQLAAGSYTVNASAAGYQSNSTSVTLTPGNTSSVSVDLAAVPSSGSSLLSGTTATIALFVSGAVIAIIVIAVLVVRMGSRGRSPPRGGAGGPGAPPNGL